MPFLLSQPHYHRLGDVLNRGLRDRTWTTFRAAVAFVKRSGIKGIADSLRVFAQRGHIRIAVGVDVHGTSVEGLESLLDCVGDRGEVFVFHNENGWTFHPKMYVLSNDTSAEVIIGSGNLTHGGLFDNYEASVVLSLDFADDDDQAFFIDLKAILDAYFDLRPGTAVALTDETLQRLTADGYILREAEMRPPARRPPAPLPEDGVRPPVTQLFKNVPVPAPPAVSVIAGGPPPPAARAGARRGFVIQIKPHHNGEIFLSKKAVNDNPEFFGFPFRGRTTPKRAGNPSYPQRVPDPIVNIRVYGKARSPMLSLDRYGLNTVYYEPKSEIRITASPLKTVPPYSVMILQHSDVDGVDYEITIHRLESPRYLTWLKRCDNPMPGGGKRERYFGWF